MISSIFVCHGGPMIVKEKNEYTKFLKDLGSKLKPKAIVIFTAHWESEITTISNVDNYEMIYDFYGFEEDLYKIKYPAKGSKEVASKVKALLNDHGIESKLDNYRGIDHGAWDILYLMFPEASIPIVQVSVNPYLPMAKQYAIGEALKALGEEDILVIGSGSTVHNLRTVDFYATKPIKWAEDFDNWLIEKIENKEYQDLFNYRTLAPNAKYAVPREEHFVPLFIAMGSGSLPQPKLLHQSYNYGTLSYLCFEF